MVSLYSCPTCGQTTKISEAMRLFLAGQHIAGLHLTPTERAVLVNLLRKSMTIRELTNIVYAERADPPEYAEETIRFTVTRLRSKLGVEVLPVQRGRHGLQMVDIHAVERVLERGLAA